MGGGIVHLAGVPCGGARVCVNPSGGVGPSLRHYQWLAWGCLAGFWLRVGEVSYLCLGDVSMPMAVAVMRRWAGCSVGLVLCIAGIVQWYPPRPRRRGAGVRCSGRACLWRPAMGSLVL